MPLASERRQIGALDARRISGFVGASATKSWRRVTVWPLERGTCVARYHLDATFSRVTEVEPILPSHPTFAQPTTGALKGDALYVIANSQVQLIRALEAGDLSGGRVRLADPVILRVPLVRWARDDARGQQRPDQLDIAARRR